MEIPGRPLPPFGPQPGPEEDLLRRAQGGDPSAFGALFDRHVGDLEARIGWRISPALRRKVSIADVVQETRIAAFERCPSFEDRGAGAFRAWLLGIAEMQSKRAVRRFTGVAKRDARREVSCADAGDRGPEVAWGRTPSEVAMAAEIRESVARALDSIPVDYREILRLTHFSGLSLREAAERMGRSREAAKKLYGRAMLRFTATLTAQARP